MVHPQVLYPALRKSSFLEAAIGGDATEFNHVTKTGGFVVEFGNSRKDRQTREADATNSEAVRFLPRLERY
jgi:hypothetical protein